jgi:hypothetical protein
MAIRPVDIPIVDYATLVRFLAPSNADESGKLPDGEAPRFDKPWQRQAKAGWHWTDAELSTMWFAAQQGENSNWRRQIIPPCDVLGDMMYGHQTALVGRPVLVDFADGNGREAWVFPIREDLEAVFFKDCSNPSWRVKITQVSQTVTALPPQPEPAPALPDVCKNIPGAKSIPPGYVVNEAGNCVVPPQPQTAPPIVVQSPAPSQPSNAYAGALTYVQVNASPQQAAFQPPLNTVSRISLPAVIKVEANVTVRHVASCEGKACPGWTYGFRNFGQGLGSILTGGGVAAMPFALRSGMIRSAQITADGNVAAAAARKPDVITISGVNSPTFNNTPSFSNANSNTFTPTNSFTPTNTNNPTFNAPTYTPPTYTPPTYTPPTYTPPTYTPPTYTPPTYTPPTYTPPTYTPPPTTTVDLCPNIPGIQSTLPGPDWNIIGGECKQPGSPPPRP